MAISRGCRSAGTRRRMRPRSSATFGRSGDMERILVRPAGGPPDSPDPVPGRVRRTLTRSPPGGSYDTMTGGSRLFRSAEWRLFDALSRADAPLGLAWWALAGLRG